MQNNTIDERVSLLEVQVADLREDITEVDEDVTGLDEDVNFLFDEQVIQDERLLNLEETSDGIISELHVIEDELESECFSSFFSCACVSSIEFIIHNLHEVIQNKKSIVLQMC